MHYDTVMTQDNSKAGIVKTMKFVCWNRLYLFTKEWHNKNQ